ncbi:MAG: zinc ribbon domain-containing protein [Methyloceanibacter sp.]|nr:zinc ribbon domain-containing protein [Methyloceanibacter sp.]
MGPLLDLVGAPAQGPLSPRLLMGDAHKLAALDRSALEQAGLLHADKEAGARPDAVFETAAHVLLNPHTNLTLKLLTPVAEVETNVQFPGSAAQGGGVALNRVRDRYRAKWPVSAAEIYRLLQTWFLSAIGDVPGQSFQALLDPLAATAFFGVADLIRSKNKRPEDPEGPSELYFDKDELMQFLAEREAGNSIDDLRLYATMAMGRTAQISASNLDQILRRLVTLGALEQDATQYRAAGVLVMLGNPLLLPERAMHWHEVHLGKIGDVSVRSRMAVQLGQALLLVFDAVDEGVLVRATSGEELGNDFLEELGRPAIEGQTCLSCGAYVAPENKFCTRCGAAVRRPAERPQPVKVNACPKCGAEIKKGNMFCTHCGAQVSPQ